MNHRLFYRSPEPNLPYLRAHERTVNHFIWTCAVATVLLVIALFLESGGLS